MKKRIFYLDLLRSYAIVMVLIIHSIRPYILETGLYGTTSWYINLFLNAFARTGVPVFLMLSGNFMLSSEQTVNFKEFYKKRLLRILIPLVAWNLIYFVLNGLFGFEEFTVKKLISGIANCGTEYHLWYLYTLAGLYLISPFLKILINNCTKAQLVWLLFLMLLCTSILPLLNLLPVYITFFDPLFNGYIACYFMGYILARVDCSRKNVVWFSVFGVLGLIASIYFNHTYSSAETINLVSNFGYNLPHYAMAAAVFMIAKFFFENRTFCKGIVLSLSKYSFGIYLIHVTIIDVILDRFMIDASPMMSALYIFVIALILSWLITFVLSKIKYIRKIVM